MEIKVLLRHGHSVRSITRQLGCSRNTVRRYLHDADAQQYKARDARPSKLDAYKPYLQSRIEAARPHWIPGAVLYREIAALGYVGGLTQLKAFISEFKHVPLAPVVRFETEPGQQMQADFTHIRRGRAPIVAFVATLGYSRASYVRFANNERADTLNDCLGEAFYYFGGVPRHVLFDNAGTIVIERDAYGAGGHRWHGRLLALSEHFGFIPRLCRPYRARTKGKVERFNAYLKGSFCVPLAATLKQTGLHLDVGACNAHVGRWLAEVANCRIHATTRERPDQRLQIEQAALLPLPVVSERNDVPIAMVAESGARPLPVESLQHPLSVYDGLLEARP